MLVVVVRIVAIGATSSNGMCRVINQINLTKTVEREKKRGKERKKERTQNGNFVVGP